MIGVGREKVVINKGMTSKNKTRVSIGLPVFNGEMHLEEAIDSILSQTYSDFELIISDNASTDKTQEICKAYEARDRRICYYRNEKNLGAARNFNRVFELSSGEYFKWAAHDDLLTPDFLLRCVEVLDHDASVVLCYPRTEIIDEHGKFLRNYDVKLNTDSPKPHERFHDLICIFHGCYQIFGLIRASALKMTSLIGNFTGSDRNLLVELGLINRFYEIPERLFFSRDHPQRSIRHVSFYSRAAWFDPAKERQVAFPHWKRFLEYLRSLRRASLNRYERARCYLHMVQWLGMKFNWQWLLKDLIMAVRSAVWIFLWKAKRVFLQK
ncbi:MAG: glycosyltransferase [Candidatus Brocadia sinica]|nr:MAG: glycosyltransferase [Candidatus Brocadia sinica]